MTTAKQLAWRKKFAAMAKAGTLKKVTRKKNPSKSLIKITAKKKNPVKEVVRKNPVVAVKGFLVKERRGTDWQVVAVCPTQAKGLEVAQLLANKTKIQHAVF